MQSVEITLAQPYCVDEPDRRPPFFCLNAQFEESDCGETVLLWLSKAVAGSQLVQKLSQTSESFTMHYWESGN